MKRLAGLLLVLALTGCVTHGTAWFDPKVVETFEPGITTYREVLLVLGQPRKTERNADGTVTYFWTSVKSGPFFADAVSAELQFEKEGRDAKMIRIVELDD